MLENKKIDLKTAVFAILISLGSALRIVFLDQNNIWYDEGYLLIASGYFNIPELNSTIINPPLYYILMKFWIKLFGVSELSLRLPSAIFSSAALLVFFALAKKMFNKNTALFALFFIALSPFHLWYAQEATSYAQTMFFGLLSTYFFYNCFFGIAGKKNIILYTAFTLMSITSNHFAIMLFAAQALYISLSEDNNPIKKWMVLSPLIFFAPFLYYLLKGAGFVARGFWVPIPDWKSLLFTFENFILGYHGTETLYMIADITVLSLLLVLLINFFKKNIAKKEIFLCLFLSLLPVSLIFIFSRHVFSVYLDRALLIFTPYFYILLGNAIEKTKPRLLRIGIVLVLTCAMSISVTRYYNNQMYQPYDARHHMGTFIKKPIEPLVACLKARLTPDSLFIFGNNAVIPMVLYYSRISADAARAISYFSYDPAIVDDNTQLLFGQLDKSLQFPFLKSKDALIEMIKNKRIKVFFIGGRFQRDGLLDKNSESVKDALDKNLDIVEDLTVDGTRISIYRNYQP